MENYQVMRAIGKGSFGKVYLVRSKKDRKHYCCKQIKLTNIPKKERDACKHEVRLMQRLRHPNIVGFKDSFFARRGDVLCIVMTYCDGGDLSGRIAKARGRRFKEHQIMHWFVQLALGLHFMHSNKVLHRDLKTQNIFLLGNGRLVLGDLGISKVLEGTMDFAKTCIGTPYYMSPELFKNKPYNHKSDVWALGCVLYELCTLKHAFDANSLNGLACKIIRGYHKPIHPTYSRHLRELVKSMLAKNPSSRPSMKDILRKSYIKKHLGAFFNDLVNRTTKVSEGTMAQRGALGAILNGAKNQARDMVALQKQLEALQLTSLIERALNVKKPGDDDGSTTSSGSSSSSSGEGSKLIRKKQSALTRRTDAPSRVPRRRKKDNGVSRMKRFLREQEEALQREKERQRAVQEALEKLRKEREDRMKQRQKIRERNYNRARNNRLRQQRERNPRSFQRKRQNEIKREREAQYQRAQQLQDQALKQNQERGLARQKHAKQEDLRKKKKEVEALSQWKPPEKPKRSAHEKEMLRKQHRAYVDEMNAKMKAVEERRRSMGKQKKSDDSSSRSSVKAHSVASSAASKASDIIKSREKELQRLEGGRNRDGSTYESKYEHDYEGKLSRDAIHQEQQAARDRKRRERQLQEAQRNNSNSTLHRKLDAMQQGVTDLAKGANVRPVRRSRDKPITKNVFQKRKDSSSSSSSSSTDALSTKDEVLARKAAKKREEERAKLEAHRKAILLQKEDKRKSKANAKAQYRESSTRLKESKSQDEKPPHRNREISRAKSYEQKSQDDETLESLRANMPGSRYSKADDLRHANSNEDDVGLIDADEFESDEENNAERLDSDNESEEIYVAGVNNEEDAQVADAEEDEEWKAKEKELGDELRRTALRCDHLKKTLEQARRTLKAQNVEDTRTNKTADKGGDDDNATDEEFEECWSQPLQTQFIKEESDEYSDTDSGTSDQDDGPSDPPSPVGRLSERIAILRRRLIKELGEARFQKAYKHIKGIMRNAQDDGEEDESAMRKRIEAILGENDKLAFMRYQDMNALLLMEETHNSN